jgi:dTDP-4-amino-4,6-dideoxygalactose transaminase
VLRELAAGRSNKEIAAALGVAEGTVKVHAARVYEKLGASSRTEALALALRALDIGPGDEVIVPANSFIATAEAVTLVGATPCFVDVDPGSALVTAAHVEPAIGPRTRAVIPVHLYGRTVDLDPIVALARRSGIAVIEDACQAHGAWVGPGRRAGSVGDCAAFSFYPAKNLGAWGDAGGLVTNDDAIADRVRLLRSHGERPRYNHLVPGTTARMDSIHAAVLRIKLRRLDAANAARRRIAGALSDALAGALVGRPLKVGKGDHVYHQFVVRTAEREAFRQHLGRYGVSTGVHYPVAIHRSPAYRSAGLGAGSLPVAESLAATVCSLPMHPSLNREEIGRVAAAVHAFAESEPVRRAA